jgi:S1-C subfamily serine protease
MPILFFCKQYLVFVVALLCFFHSFDGRVVVAQQQDTIKTDRNLTSVMVLVREIASPTSDKPITAWGTAFIIHSSGIAITCNHVICNNAICNNVTCNHRVNDGRHNGKLFSIDKKFYPFQVIGRDPQYDLAIIQIAGNESFTSIPISEHEISISGNAHGIFNLYNNGLFYIRGYLSAINEAQTEFLAHPRMLVFNMSTAIGASGGPIISERGELIAVACGKMDSNFILGIPSSDILPAIKKVASLETVFGLETGIQYETKRLSEKTGIYVSKVADNSEAEKVGIVVGDQVLAIGQWEVNSAVDFELSALAWGYKYPKAPMAIKVKKQDGTLADLQVQLAPRQL